MTIQILVILLSQFKAVSCSVKTVASWSIFTFLRTQVMLSGIPILLIIFHIFFFFFCDPNRQSLFHSQWSSSKYISVISMLFLWSNECGNLISGSSAFPISYIWEFLVHILLKPSLKYFDHYLARMWNECNCTHSLALPFFGTGMKAGLFQSVATTEFSKFADILSVAL